MKPPIRGIPGSDDLPELLTVPEAAERMRVSTNTIYRLLAAAEIRRLKVGSRTLIARSDLHRYLNRTSTDPAPSQI